jgi:hypothetical protein
LPSQELPAKWFATGDQRTEEMVSVASDGSCISADAPLLVRGDVKAVALDDVAMAAMSGKLPEDWAMMKAHEKDVIVDDWLAWVIPCFKKNAGWIFNPLRPSSSLCSTEDNSKTRKQCPAKRRCDVNLP